MMAIKHQGYTLRTPSQMPTTLRETNHLGDRICILSSDTMAEGSIVVSPANPLLFPPKIPGAGAHDTRFVRSIRRPA